MKLEYVETFRKHENAKSIFYRAAASRIISETRLSRGVSFENLSTNVYRKSEMRKGILDAHNMEKCIVHSELVRSKIYS